MKTYLEKLFIIDGVLLAVVGALFFINPLDTLVGFEKIIGILVILIAFSKIFRAWQGKNKIHVIFTGVIDILFGLILIFSPLETVELMLVCYGVWALIRGVYSLFMCFQSHTFGMNVRSGMAVATTVIGLIIILCPIVLIFAIPYIPYVIGAYFMFLAITEIYIGCKL
ncbi:MAG: HdeD family acid-resistance protein [Cellulosilyticaceae bacterium]